MTRLEKVLWEDIIKVLSFNITSNFIDELAINNVYDEDIRNISRYIIDPRKLPHYETDTFDIWNTYIEKVLPSKFLDCVEENINEDRACDIEDYYFYMHKRMIHGVIFNYWWTIFNDFKIKNPDIIIINDDLDQLINSYLDYCEETTKSIEEYEIDDEWDNYINSLYLPENNLEEEVDYNYIKEQINKFSFLDISYDFWLKINEFDDNTLDTIKEWAIIHYGDESEPFIPIISEEFEEENE